MYLKEINISGFKSFADKMNMSLDNNITCVVGPNGSGKSNIVDAIRWVLGEQSVKNLRGSSSMTDVIFSGSSSRNPLNVASVSITFDNSDSYLKVPYTEISVSRKVYRSGENEYYLNNERCRLKDISDLFLDSGMGKYAFNIISQGEISKIISDSPYDRRVLFEEAAGVLKYKKRKEEALKKLAKTNENLVRVKDILTELSTQIEPLKEQSEQAEIYLNIKDQLEHVEIALIVTDLEKNDFDYKECDKLIEELENDIIKINTLSTNMDLSLESKKDELNKINQSIVNLNNKFLDLTKEEERLNGEKNIINERSKYNASDPKVHDNLKSLNEEKLLLHNKLLSIKTDNDILYNKIDDLDSVLEVKKENLKDIQENRNEVEVSLFDKNKELTNIGYKIKSLEDFIENGGVTPLSVRKVLNNPKLFGIHDIISSLINTSNEYLLALEVALGGAKDYVVVDSPIVAKKCISYLKDNGLGRVTFYPLDVIKPRYIDDTVLNSIKNEDGFIGVFADLVSFSNIYRNVIFNQLGNVILVRDIDCAHNISRMINNRYKIVTLDGEVINVGGSITGGTYKTKSIISEKYELDKLLNKKDVLSKEIDKCNSQIDLILQDEKKIQGDIISLEKEKIILNEELKSKKDNYDLVSKSYDAKSLELSNLEDLVDGKLNDEEEKVINKYYEVLNTKDSVLKESKERLRDKEDIEAEIEKLEAGYRLNNSDVRNKEKELKDLEIKHTKISAKMDNLLNILSDNYNMTYEKAKANYVLEMDYDVAHKLVKNLKSKLKDVGVVNIGAIEEYKRVNERYSFLNKQNDDLESAQETLLNIIDELDKVMKDEFIKTFKEIQIEFDKVFKDLFGGGSTLLKLTDKDNILETGIDIIVTPPGKKVSSISLLSGGEKTLTAISLLFAILNIKNVPFCIFDEIEAALDEVNVDRVGSYLNRYKNKTQLIIITHKKKTMEYANTLYGITMQESGVSKLVSVKLVD